MALYEALYGRKCQFLLCWYKSGEKSLLGPEIIAKTTEQIKKMLITQSHQKSYADQRRKPLEFEEGEHVFLKRIRPVAYRIALPPHLSKLNNVFHMLQLHKYTPDASHILESEPVQVREYLTLSVIPVRIDDITIKRLCGKEVSLVKVA
ncbi:uncharacterized protein [Arachis hypogaea]|uniref:uncharacterized protein n=1 Tax=Arachis hypogaea TaxID=3818 RepID=UPI003B2115FC